MANTGYKINPKVIQYFTSGPLSGSEVSPSYSVEFSSSFTSSVLCGNEYYYKELDELNCLPPDACISPTITSISPIQCGSDTGWDYEIDWLINEDISNVPQTVISYSNDPSFLTSNSISVNAQTITNTSSSMNYIINVSDLSNLPLNKKSPIYFRLQNICNESLSSYVDSSAQCVAEQNDDGVNLIVLSQNPPQSLNYCAPDEFGITYDNGFVGNVYYINNTFFVTATSLYKNNSASLISADPNWYSDGNIARYWNGVNFTQTITCQ